MSLKTIETLDRRPFKHFCATIGELPTSFIDSMSYYEVLAWFCQYLEKTVIPTINENAEAVKELQDLFVELKAYVDDYFQNLDVQEEINNKLDAMAEAGTLQEIIAEYLNTKAVFGFDSIADMKNATNLIDGSFARTLGYHNKEDNGGSFYKIRNVTNDDVVDDMNIIEITGDTSNNLVAELIIENEIKPEQFGCYGDGTSDDTISMQACINKAILTGLPVIANNSYLISSSLTINGSITIKGNKGISDLAEASKQSFIFTGEGYLFNTTSEYKASLFENLRITGLSTNSIFCNKGYRNKYIGLTISTCNKAIDFAGSIEIWKGENRIENCFFNACNIAINIDDKLYCDSEIICCIFKGGNYAVYGNFNAWVFTNCHDYSIKGIEVTNCANTQFTDNYFDKSEHMPFIKITTTIRGSTIISDNKFLTGNNISTPSSVIEFNDTVQGSCLILTNNGASGVKYGTSYFLDLTGTQNTSISFANNQMFQIVGKLVNHVSRINKGASTGFSASMPATSISGSANFNSVFFNNGTATIQLEVTNAGTVIGVLPFNPAASIRIPAWNATKSVMGSILLNSNGNITNNSNWLGDTILINATYAVYYQGNLGDN